MAGRTVLITERPPSAARRRRLARLRCGLAASLCAAAIAAAIPAFAQTNAPTAPRPQPQGPDINAREPAACPDGWTMRDANCEPGSIDGLDDFAVVLPDLLFDLFPNPVGRDRDTAPAPTGGARATDTQGAGGSAAAGGPGQAGTPAPSRVSPPLAAPRAVTGAFVPDEVLVTVDGGALEVQSIAADFNLEVRSQRISGLLGATLVRFGIPDGRPVTVVLAQLETDGRTRQRAPNHVYGLQQAATIINYAFERISLDQRRAIGDDVRVAVIDTAIDETHAALTGVVVESHDSMPGTPIVDRDHGTSIAGLIAGVGPFRGIAPGTKMFHARAFEGGQSTMDIILEAIDWAAAQDVRLINMSFVGPKNDLLELACAAARARDMVLVAAAGNNGPKAPFGYPAAYDTVIAVTATDERDQLMPQANRGAYVYVSAPGVDMVAPVGGGTDLVTGTSFAAAIVTGAIANLLHARPDSSADWIEERLAATARDLGASGRDSDFGYGLVNYEALASAR